MFPFVGKSPLLLTRTFLRRGQQKVTSVERGRLQVTQGTTRPGGLFLGQQCRVGGGALGGHYAEEGSHF